MSRPDKKRRHARPATDVRPGGREVPRAMQSIITEGSRFTRPVFCFSKLDKADNAEWGWHMLTPEHGLLDKLVEWSDNLWTEIRAGTKYQHRRHHGQSVSSLVPAARDRLAAMGWDESTIFRFGYDVMGRLWGFEYEGVFFVVWWDPDHKVYTGD